MERLLNNWEEETSGLPHGYLINMEAELQTEGSTSSDCLNLTEDH